MEHDATVYRLANYLRENHKGEANGIKRTTLADLLGIHERDLRRAMKEINESPDFEMLVSTSHCVYVCDTAKECERAIRNTYQVAIALFKKAKAMEKKAGLNGQVKIKLGDDYTDFVQTFTGDK